MIYIKQLLMIILLPSLSLAKKSISLCLILLFLIIAGMNHLQKYNVAKRNHNSFRSPQNKGLIQTKIPSFLRMTMSPSAINDQSNFELTIKPLKNINREFLRKTVDATMKKSAQNVECVNSKQQLCTGQNYNIMVKQLSGKLQTKHNLKNKPTFLNKKDKNKPPLKANSIICLQKEPEDKFGTIMKKAQSKNENPQQDLSNLKAKDSASKVPSFLKKAKDEYYQTSMSKQKIYFNNLTPSSKKLNLKHKESLITNNSSILSVGDQQSIELSIQQFKIIKKLGQGRFGNVFLAIHIQTHWLVAIKIVKKAMIKQHNLQKQFSLETKLQFYFNHPNIVKLYGLFDDKENCYLLIQYMESGTLYEHLKKHNKLTQNVVKEKMSQIFRAVQCLHQQNVAHRDIKPQNIVLSYDICKLCDFGWATVCDERRKTLCGTIDYACPQILQGKQYGISIDLWCLGVLCFELLTGKAPFYHMSKKKTMQNILNADKEEVKFPPDASLQIRDMVTKLLVKDPNERLTITQALKHHFMQQRKIVAKH